MSAQFTPGPWSWHQCFDPSGKRLTSLDVTPANGHSLTGVAVLASVFSTNEADASLIASAPALYDALSNFVEEYCDLVNSGDAGFWDPETEDKVKAARAALKQARGEV